MKRKYVLYNKADGLATTTLNRPEKLNAINFEMLEELRAERGVKYGWR